MLAGVQPVRVECREPSQVDLKGVGGFGDEPHREFSPEETIEDVARPEDRVF